MGWFKKEHSKKRRKREKREDSERLQDLKTLTSYWDRDKVAKKMANHKVFRDF